MALAINLGFSRIGANRELKKALETFWAGKSSPEDLLKSALIFGSPETVASKVAELQQAGVGELACWMNFGGLPVDKVRRSMRLFAEEVMPGFRHAHAKVAIA